MNFLNRCSYGLIVAWLVSLVTLAGSTAAGLTNVVQTAYAAVIGLLVVTLLTAAISSVIVALERFPRYWRSGIPVLFSALLLGYAVFKSLLTPIAMAVDIGGFILGYAMSTFVLMKSWHRFVPLATILLLLTASELSMAPNIQSGTLFLLSGLMSAATIKMRRNSDMR